MRHPGWRSDAAPVPTRSTPPCSSSARRRSALELVVVTSDRGLCGAFNANVHQAGRWRSRLERSESRSSRPGLDRTGRPQGGRTTSADGAANVRSADRCRPRDGASTFDAAEIAEARLHAERFTSGEVDEVYLVYNEFVSAMTQTPHRRTAPAPGASSGRRRRRPRERLPLDRAGRREAAGGAHPQGPRGGHLPRLLENQAGEHAARMTAMESATREHRGADREPHPPIQPRAPGRDHQGAGRDRERRRSARMII